MKHLLNKNNFVLLLVFCASMFYTAQASELQGRWEITQASVLKISGSDTLTVNVDSVKNNPFFALYDTLIFEGNRLSLPVSGHLAQGEYSLTGNEIAFNFTAVAYVLKYRIADEKLYLTQRTTISYLCSDCIYLVETVYKRVNL